MSGAVFGRFVVAAIFGGIFAWKVFSRFDEEIGEESTQEDKQRYLPYLPPDLLPTIVLTILVTAVAVHGFSDGVKLSLLWYAGVFLHIGLYFAVLMVLLPFLRKWISARACAMLWMLPNYLYLMTYDFVKPERPLLVLRVPGLQLWNLVWIWVAGFGLVMGWKCFSHLRYRHQILRDAYPVTDERVLAVWQQEVEQAKFAKPKFRLVISPNVTTPVSVGVFRRSTRVVLPERSYTEEELKLIFRHELVHIGREDARSKLFLAFCTAMCWFNPLMWVAMKKSAEDLERSCDETVLLDAEEPLRRQYAELILKTAGDARGFTTCLSASAASLRYRLQNIMKPRTKRSGALVVGIVFFVLCVSCGYVALAYGGGTGAELLFGGWDIDTFTVTEIDVPEQPYQVVYENQTISQDLISYLADLKVEQVTGNYTDLADGESWVEFWLESPEGEQLLVSVKDDMVKVYPFFDGMESGNYYLPDGLDWAYLNSLLKTYPGVDLRLWCQDGYESTGTPLTISQVERNGNIVYEDPWAEQMQTGFTGFSLEQAELTFSQPAVRYILECKTDTGYQEILIQEAAMRTFPLEADSAYYRLRVLYENPEGNTDWVTYLFYIEE